jgi:hypothetical protein
VQWLRQRPMNATSNALVSMRSSIEMKVGKARSIGEEPDRPHVLDDLECSRLDRFRRVGLPCPV